MREDALSFLKSEFRLWGVKFTANTLNSGHIELVWRATPDKETRRYIIPKTPGDHRGPLNARAKIRAMFKQDGLSLKDQITKPKPVLQQALAIPEPVERDVDQLKLLRAEVADLTEMVFELAGVITSLRDHVTPAPPPAVVAPEPIVVPQMIKPKIRSIKALDFLSEAWNTTDALARDMGLSKEIAYRKLYYLMKNDQAELCGGSWRKKPTLRLVAAE